MFAIDLDFTFAQHKKDKYHRFDTSFPLLTAVLSPLEMDETDLDLLFQSHSSQMQHS